jgi:hypothetical protein
MTQDRDQWRSCKHSNELCFHNRLDSVPLAKRLLASQERPFSMQLLETIWNRSTAVAVIAWDAYLNYVPHIASLHCLKSSKWKQV